MLPESPRGRPLTRILEDRRLVGIVALAAVCKLAIPALIALAYLMLPFNSEMRSLNFVYPPEDEVGLHSAFQTWDGQHYIYLAEQGYRARQMSNVFYPLYPMLLRLTGAVFGSTLTAGLVLSAALSLIATASLYLMARDLFDPGVAFRCGLFLLAFPTSFYTSLVYSEALFLALVIMLFLFLYRRRTVPAVVCAVLLPLTRPQGVLVALAVVVFLVVALRRRERCLTQVLALAGFGVGFGVYLALMRSWTGSAWAGFEAQRMFVAGNDLLHTLNLPAWFWRNFVDIDLAVHGYTNSLMDRLFFVGFLMSLLLVYRHLDGTLFTYAAVMGLVPALAGSFMAYSRYLLLVFPVFIALAAHFDRRSWMLLAPMAVLQVVLLIFHALNYWVA